MDYYVLNLLCDVRSSLIDCLMIHQLKRMSMYMSITLSRLLLLPSFYHHILDQTCVVVVVTSFCYC